MKILSTFTSLGTVTSSGADASFPVTNVQNLKPMVRWVADAYAGDVWIKADLGSAKVLTAAFLNQANFPACKIQGNASDSWGSPSFSLDCTLVRDDTDNRKGWFDLVAFNYRWIRILIASAQTLDNSETVPALGNFIVGAAASVPAVIDFGVRIIKRFDRFESDGGSLNKEARGRARHVLSFTCEDAIATIRAMDKTWDDAVAFADWGNAAESWLVFPPEDWEKPIQVGSDFQLKFSCEERA
jgi:hypothetical protein